MKNRNRRRRWGRVHGNNASLRPRCALARDPEVRPPRRPRGVPRALPGPARARRRRCASRSCSSRRSSARAGRSSASSSTATRSATRTRARSTSATRASGSGRRSTCARPETWFDVLYESPVELHLREGYVKHKEARLEPGHDVFPFVFLPRLQRAIFEQAARRARRPSGTCSTPTSRRTSTPGSTTRTSTPAPKRAVTGFTPLLGVEPGNAERFFAAYPDGTLISIVRDPAAWYESARKYRERWRTSTAALAEWTRSTQAALDARSSSASGSSWSPTSSSSSTPRGRCAGVAERIGIELLAGAARADIQRPAGPGELERARCRSTGSCRSGRPPIGESLDADDDRADRGARRRALYERGRSRWRPQYHQSASEGPLRHDATRPSVRSYGRVLRLLADARATRSTSPSGGSRPASRTEALRDSPRSAQDVTFGALPGRGSPGFGRDRARLGRARRAPPLQHRLPALPGAGLRRRAGAAARARSASAQPFVRRDARLARPAGTPGVRALPHDAGGRRALPRPAAARRALRRRPGAGRRRSSPTSPSSARARPTTSAPPTASGSTRRTPSSAGTT